MGHWISRKFFTVIYNIINHWWWQQTHTHTQVKSNEKKMFYFFRLSFHIWFFSYVFARWFDISLLSLLSFKCHTNESFCFRNGTGNVFGCIYIYIYIIYYSNENECNWRQLNTTNINKKLKWKKRMSVTQSQVIVMNIDYLLLHYSIMWIEHRLKRVRVCPLYCWSYVINIIQFMFM